MIAFVMSGGGNRGALQAGALQELFEAGIVPEILVGTSAGALNATFLATDPTLDGARRLADLWRHADRDDFFPGNPLDILRRLATGDSLFPSEPLRAFLERQLPAAKRRYGDLTGIRLYVTAANLNQGKLYLYGEKPEASLVEAALASAAHPLAFPPVRAAEAQLVDGGVVANVPVGIAIEKGATEVYILNVGYGGEAVEDQDGIIDVLSRCIGVMMYQPLLLDLRLARERTDIKLHHILIAGFQSSKLWEVEHGAEMVELGRRAARDYLANPTGLGDISFAPPVATAAAAPPSGAVEYTPVWLR